MVEDHVPCSQVILYLEIHALEHISTYGSFTDAEDQVKFAIVLLSSFTSKAMVQ